MNLHSVQKFLIANRPLLLCIVLTACMFACFALPAYALPAEDAVDGVGSTVTPGAATTNAGNTDPVSLVGGFVESGIAYLIYGIALGIGGMVAGLGAVLLDLSFSKTVLEFGVLVNASTGLGTGIRELWGVIRDIFNILFIFGLIFIGIKTVLNSEDSGTRRSLGLLIIAALMINFSLYITQVIVDFTNIAAVQAFNQITNEAVGASGVGGGGAGGATVVDSLLNMGHNTITGAFLDVAGVTSFLGGIPEGMDPGKVMIYSIFLMMFLIIAGIVFAMGAFLLISRFIALVIYMILSPIMFLGWILPSMAGRQKDWWKGFLKQAFFAPAFLFMLYLSLVVLQKLKGLMVTGTGTKFTDMVTGEGMTVDIFTLILFFVMMIGFLYASIRVSQMMGVAGAGTAMSITQKTIGGATSGLVARAGRSTLGWGAQRFIADNEKLTEAASKKGLRGDLARGVLNSGRYVGDASFDARKTGIAGKTFGEGKKGGFKTRSEEIEKKEKEFAKSLGEIDEDDNAIMLMASDKSEAEKALAKLKAEKDLIRDVDGEKKLSDLKLQKDNIRDKANREKVVALDTERANLDPNVESDRKRMREIDGELIQTKATIENNELSEKTRLSNEIATTETQIKEAEKTAKLKMTQDIEAAEKKVKEYDEAIKREKNRRQIGTDVDAKSYEATQERYKAVEDKKKELTKELGKETNRDARIKLAEQIKEENKKLKELKQEAKEKGGTLGYAGKLEKAGFWGSVPFARTVNQNKEAGKAIRKQYEKAVKRTKEEAQNEGLKEAFAKASK